MNSDRGQDGARRGMELVARLPDIMPDGASERVGEIYRDIQDTLRVPIVNLIFRSLANYPDYLEGAWERLRPVLRTQRFERAADRLRAEALLEPVPDASGVDWGGTGDLERIRAFNDTIHYVLPKLLLIATALDEMHFGPGGDATAAAVADPRAIPTGAAEGTAKVEMVDPEKASERVRALFESVRERHGHPLVSSYYRGLGNWPDFLDAAWERVGPVVHSGPYDARRDALVQSARAAVRELPVTEGAGAELDEGQRAEVRDILAGFRTRFIPEMLLDAALIKALIDGTGAARASRFSAAQGPGGAATPGR